MISQNIETCPVCGEKSVYDGGKGNMYWAISWDRMSGDRDTLFVYHKCIRCRAIYCGTHIPDISKYYGDDYYSYNLVDTQMIHRAQTYIDTYGLTETTSVLDFGAGTTGLLEALYKQGVGEQGKLHKLRAYDPYGTPSNGAIKLQTTLPSDMTFDFVISNHSIEHTNNILKYLRDLAYVTSPNGRIVIACPNSESIVFDIFRGDTVQLDPPRHLCVISPATLKYLIARHNLPLSIDEIKYDSTAWGTAMSVAYQQGMTYTEAGEWCSKLSMDDKMAYNGWSVIANKLRVADQFTCTLTRIK